MGKSKQRKHSRGPTQRKEFVPPSPTDAKFSFKKFYLPIVILISIIAFSLHLHGADYSRRAGALTFDESLYARLGFQIKNNMGYGTEQIYNEQLKQGRKLPAYVNKPIFKHPPVFASLISASYYVFLPKKDNYQMAELYQSASKVSNIMGCLLIILVFIMGRKFFNERVGLLAAILLALDFNLWICSQKVWMETTMVFLMWLTLYILMKGIERKEFFYLAGFIGGLGMLTKYPAVLVFLTFFTYALIYERQIFKQKEFYLGLSITGLMMVPWFYVNYKHYGTEFVDRILFSGGGYHEKIEAFTKWTAAIIVIGGLMALFRKLRERLFCGLHAVQSKLPMAFSFFIVIFISWLVIQAPFRESIGKTLSWSGFPRNGWKMGMFTEDPWYFYIKQHVEYSPFYLFFLVALIRVPLGNKYDKLLFWASFWTLCFTMLWGNFQGRYALSFVPAAALLISRTLVDFYEWLRAKKTLPWQVAFYSSLVVLSYFLIKTIRIDYIYALNGNSAYF